MRQTFAESLRYSETRSFVYDRWCGTPDFVQGKARIKFFLTPNRKKKVDN